MSGWGWMLLASFAATAVLLGLLVGRMNAALLEWSRRREERRRGGPPPPDAD